MNIAMALFMSVATVIWIVETTNRWATFDFVTGLAFIVATTIVGTSAIRYWIDAAE